MNLLISALIGILAVQGFTANARCSREQLFDILKSDLEIQFGGPIANLRVTLRGDVEQDSDTATHLISFNSAKNSWSYIGDASVSVKGPCKVQLKTGYDATINRDGQFN